MKAKGSLTLASLFVLMILAFAALLAWQATPVANAADVEATFVVTGSFLPAGLLRLPVPRRLRLSATHPPPSPYRSG